jgi:hypothetical protein
LKLDDLRRFAVARSLFPPTTLRRAIARMGFVQADPIRAPARAQDLILRQRVKDYRAGDLERRYDKLEVEEDFFVNYGFVTHVIQLLMHPRPHRLLPADVARPSPRVQREQEKMLLAFVEERGAVHPREVEAHFGHGRVTNYWGGSSHATTQMLDALHYRGKLRVARRDNGIRLYCAHRREADLPDDAALRARLDLLVDVVVNLYAPLPAPSLSYYVKRLRYAVPQWEGKIGAALARARERLTHARISEIDWYWPNEEIPLSAPPPQGVHLVAPFDPIVHDRKRFELFWGWLYRFEAYTPAPKRKLGYYALPMLWRGRVIGWANLVLRNTTLTRELGYVAGQAPRERAFRSGLAAELEQMRLFLGAKS